MRKSKTVPSRKVACNSPTPPHPYLGKAVNLTCICQMFHRANSNFHLFKGSKGNTNSERIASVPLSAIVKYNTKIFSKPSTISGFFISIPRKFSSLSSAFLCTFANHMQAPTSTMFTLWLTKMEKTKLLYRYTQQHPILHVSHTYRLTRVYSLTPFYKSTTSISLCANYSFLITKQIYSNYSFKKNRFEKKLVFARMRSKYRRLSFASFFFRQWLCHFESKHTTIFFFCCRHYERVEVYIVHTFVQVPHKTDYDDKKKKKKYASLMLPSVSAKHYIIWSHEKIENLCFFF